MTADEAIAELKALQQSTNPEEAHLRADEVLCELLDSLGCAEVEDEFKKVSRWYS